MKAILSAALVLGLCGPAAARDDKAGPVGTWKCEYEIGDQKQEATLAVKKDGGKLAGTMTFQDKQVAPLKEPAFKGGVLTFSVDREINGMKITVEYKLTIDGDKFKGKGAAEFGGEKREFDIAGQREKK